MKILFVLLLFLQAIISQAISDDDKSDDDDATISISSTNTPIYIPNAFIQNTGFSTEVTPDILEIIKTFFVNSLFEHEQWRPFFDLLTDGHRFENIDIPGNPEPVDFYEFHVIHLTRPKNVVVNTTDRGINLHIERFKMGVAMNYTANGKAGRIEAHCLDTTVFARFVFGVNGNSNEDTHDHDDNNQRVYISIDDAKFNCRSSLKIYNKGELGNRGIRFLVRLGRLPLLNRILRSKVTPMLEDLMRQFHFDFGLKSMATMLNDGVQILFQSNLHMEDRIRFVDPQFSMVGKSLVLRFGATFDSQGLRNARNEESYELYFRNDPPSIWKTEPDADGRYILPVLDTKTHKKLSMGMVKIQTQFKEALHEGRDTLKHTAKKIKNIFKR